MNAGQQVSAADAAMLTAALDRAVGAPDLVDTVIRIRGELSEEVAKLNPRWRDDVSSATREQAEGFADRVGGAGASGVVQDRVKAIRPQVQ